MSISKIKMLQVSKCLIGLAVMVLQSCDVAENRRDLLCGKWESVELQYMIFGKSNKDQNEKKS